MRGVERGEGKEAAATLVNFGGFDLDGISSFQDFSSVLEPKQIK